MSHNHPETSDENKTPVLDTTASLEGSDSEAHPIPERIVEFVAAHARENPLNTLCSKSEGTEEDVGELVLEQIDESLNETCFTSPGERWPMSKDPYFFVSHTGRDGVREDIARPTHWFLTNVLKVRAFLDDESLHPGDKIIEALMAPAYECTHALVILSPTYRSRSFCVRELNTFMARLRKRDGIRVLPALWYMHNVHGYHADVDTLVRIEHRGRRGPADYMIQTLWPALVRDLRDSRGLDFPDMTSDTLQEHLFKYIESREIPLWWLETFARRQHGGAPDLDSDNNNSIFRWPKSRAGRLAWMVPTMLIVLAVVVVVAIIVPPRNGSRNDRNHVTPTASFEGTLDNIVEYGALRCGITKSLGKAFPNPITGEPEGFNVDLCRALGAAIFGKDGKVEFVYVESTTRFQDLHSGRVDVLASLDTHTMERDVYEPTTGVGFSFSVPYFYDGLVFAGIPLYTDCANERNITACLDLKVCVVDGTTHVSIVRELVPDTPTILTTSIEESIDKFQEGRCNVLAGEQFDIAEYVVQKAGYEGEYVVDERLLSKEPLALVTREDDPQWSDFVNWVLQSLITAEEEGFTQDSMVSFNSTNLFQERFQNMSEDALRTVGNYGEMYDRHLDLIVPRSGLNVINTGRSGLIYAMPFGPMHTYGPGPIDGGTLDKIRKRGFLSCGISPRAIFAHLNSTTQEWSGFDVDFCRAISAAIFDGVTDNIVFTDLPANVRFQVLHKGDVDVLSRLTTVTFARDVLEPNTQTGFSFTQPNFYDGLSFGGRPRFVECANNGDFESAACRKIKICVNKGTTFDRISRDIFSADVLVRKPSGKAVIEGLTAGDCNAIAGGIIDVSISNVRNGGYTGPYEAGTVRFSKEPLAPVTRQDDPQWSDFVYWVVSSLFYAEEQGLTSKTASKMPKTNLFGPLYSTSFRDIVEAVGSSAEIYARNVESEVPRGTGLMNVNTFPYGPQMYSHPGLVDRLYSDFIG